MAIRLIYQVYNWSMVPEKVRYSLSVTLCTSLPFYNRKEEYLIVSAEDEYRYLRAEKIFHPSS